MARLMTHRERMAAQKVWDMFNPDNECGCFMTVDAGKTIEGRQLIRQEAKRYVPEKHFSKVKFTETLVDGGKLSMAWNYIP